MKLLTNLLLFILITAGSSCNLLDNKESTVHNALQNQIATESGGALQLNKFKKTDGIEQEFMGAKLYTLQWQATLTAKNEFWKAGNPFSGYCQSFHVIKKEPHGWDAFMASNPKHFTAQTPIYLNGETTLTKNENGWKIQNTKVIGDGVFN